MTQHKHEAATPQPMPAEDPDALLQKFQKQKKEIEEFADKFIAEYESPTKVKKKTRAKSPVTIIIEMQNPGREIAGMPRQFETTPQEALSGISVAHFRNACFASMSARTALKQGRIEDFYTHLFSAERQLGAAGAYPEADKMLSDIASSKADASHVARGTHARKKGVLDFWRNNIDPTMSADRAATEIDRRYLSKPGEISFRTLAEWVSAEKKKIAPSSQTTRLRPPDVSAGRLISPKPPRRS